MSKVYKIALTGGPGGGKTDSLASLTNYFTAKGYKVFTVPEVFSLVCLMGMSFEDVRGENTGLALAPVQTALASLQMALEKSVCDLALCLDRTAIVFCDNGLIDRLSFMGQEDFETFMKKNKFFVGGLFGMYDAVIHMTSLAHSLDTPEGRRALGVENAKKRLEASKNIDREAFRLWNNHPNYFSVGVTEGFQEKVEKVISIVEQLIPPLEEKKKEEEMKEQELESDYERERTASG
jgi:hypothetical protein